MAESIVNGLVTRAIIRLSLDSLRLHYKYIKIQNIQKYIE